MCEGVLKFESQKEWERKTSSICCFTPHQAAIARAELGWSREPGVSSRSQSGWLGPERWAILCCFSHTTSRELDRKWIVQRLNQHLRVIWQDTQWFYVLCQDASLVHDLTWSYREEVRTRELLIGRPLTPQHIHLACRQLNELVSSESWVLHTSYSVILLGEAGGKFSHRPHNSSWSQALRTWVMHNILFIILGQPSMLFFFFF